MKNSLGIIKSANLSAIALGFVMTFYGAPAQAATASFTCSGDVIDCNDASFFSSFSFSDGASVLAFLDAGSFIDTNVAVLRDQQASISGTADVYVKTSGPLRAGLLTYEVGAGGCFFVPPGGSGDALAQSSISGVATYGESESLDTCGGGLTGTVEVVLGTPFLISLEVSGSSFLFQDFIGDWVSSSGTGSALASLQFSELDGTAVEAFETDGPVSSVPEPATFTVAGLVLGLWGLRVRGRGVSRMNRSAGSI